MIYHYFMNFCLSVQIINLIIKRLNLNYIVLFLIYMSSTVSGCNWNTRGGGGGLTEQFFEWCGGEGHSLPPNGKLLSSTTIFVKNFYAKNQKYLKNSVSLTWDPWLKDTHKNCWKSNLEKIGKKCVPWNCP